MPLNPNGYSDEELRQKVLELSARGLTPPRIAAQLGVLRADVCKILASEAARRQREQGPAAASRGKYTLEFQLQVLDRIAETGDIEAAAREFGINDGTIRRWLSPDSYTSRPVRQLIEADPRVADFAVQQAIAALHREDQLHALLTEKRASLGQKLYEVAELCWTRVAEKARERDVQDKQLKALVAAGHYAVQDAQLLSGQPTERVEGMLRELSQLTDEELYEFVHGGRWLSLPPREEVDREGLVNG